MKQLSYFLLFIVALSSCGSSCNKDKEKWEEVEFEFAIPVNITPGADTVNVGQELSLSIDFSDSLFDVHSQKKYYLPNFNFKTVAVIMKLTNPLTSVTEQTPAIGKFEFIYDTGNLSNLSSRFADVNYKYENNMYSLRIKLKPKETGVYIVFLYHSTGTRGHTVLPQELAPNEPGVKRFPVMRRIQYKFNNGAAHFDIYKQHCKPADPNEATNWVESKATYTFVVK
jgi:hypothetical protein